jgi:homoserine dehydrogenase
LKKNRELIKKRRGVDLEFKYICDKDLTSYRGIHVDDKILTDDWKKVVNDDEIEIVIELVGGIDLPFQIFQKAIEKEKHIVTANKALLSAKGQQIYDLSIKNKILLGLEASVAGGIPIIRVVKEALVGDSINGIYGIINGTTNYILTKMIDEQMTFKEALLRAQELGFAEADPTLDINGGDAAAKISILAALAFNTSVRYEDVFVEGIEGIELQDVDYAYSMGYAIKLLAITKMHQDETIEVRVHPCLVPLDNSLAAVKNEYNAILVDSMFFGESMYYGRGAGSLPTASAVVADIIDIAEHITSMAEYSHFKDMPHYDRKIKNIKDIKSRFYMRINTEDKPGALAKTAGILAQKDISIAEVHQKETHAGFVHIVIITHEAGEKEFLECVDKINGMDFIKKDTIFFRLIE